jgi:hypothetical protein
MMSSRASRPRIFISRKIMSIRPQESFLSLRHLSIVYRLIMTPMAFLHNKFSLHQKFANRKGSSKNAEKKATSFMATIPSSWEGAIPRICFAIRRRFMWWSSGQPLAVKGLKTILEMSGALPLPSTIEGMGKMMEAMEKRNVQGHVICIYPEAHIWPYCTWIRNFKSTSFRYPAQMGSPVFSSPIVIRNAVSERNQESSLMLMVLSSPIPSFPSATKPNRFATKFMKPCANGLKKKALIPSSIMLKRMKNKHD